jgi:hypothetical protein
MKSKEESSAEVERMKEVAKQEEALLRLKRVMEARLRCESSADHAKGLVFDASLDDDEALLRLMHAVDSHQDRDGALSMEELLASKQITAEMRDAFLAAFACNLKVVEEALAHVDAEEFGEYKREVVTQGPSGGSFARKASVEALFDAMSVSGWAYKESLDSFATKFQAEGKEKLASALTALSGPLLHAKAELDFLDVKREARRVPRVRGPRVDWARRIGIDTALARHLPAGTLEDGLAGVRGMSLEEAKRAVEAFVEDAKVKILGALVATKQSTGSRSAAEANSKFAGGFQGSFATLEEFHKGAAESLNLGYPNPDTGKGIWYEHTQHPSAEKLFKTPNYSIVTSMLIEYAWAIYSQNPDEREKEVLDKAYQLIRKLIEERDGPDSVPADSELLFPGEVGDSFAESLVIFRFPASSQSATDYDKTLGETAKKAAVDFLNQDGEKARGVTIIDHKACMERISRGSSVLQQQAGQDGEDGSRRVGVLLPLPLARVQGVLEELRAKVAIASHLRSEEVAAEVLLRKTWTFSRFTAVEGLRKWLAEQSLETLEKEVEDNKWVGVSPDQTSREQLCKEMEASFVRTELRADLCSALESASDAQIEALLTGWGLKPNGSRADWLNQAAAASLDSEGWEERWGEVEGWVRLHRGRIQGRTRLGLEALMRREADKIGRYGLTKAEVLALHLYTGARPPGASRAGCALAEAAGACVWWQGRSLCR